MQRKIFSILSIFFAISFLIPFFQAKSKISFVNAQTTYYAKICANNVKLYRSTNGSEEISNIFFSIPQSYFVEISYCSNELFFAAKYIDVSGFVKRSEVQCVSGTPTTPYATASFRVFVPGGTSLRSTPSQSDGLNVMDEIQYLETNLKYYGTIEGEEAISHKSSTWYCCKLIKNGKETFGYVYSAYCDLLSTIPTNTENLDYITDPEFTKPSSTYPTNIDSTSLDSLPTATQIIIIIAVCLPCVFIIYLLFKPTKIKAQAMAEIDGKKHKKRKLRHQDYYEYDE